MWANRKENKPAKMWSAMFRGKQKSTGKPTQNTIHKNMVQKVQWDLWWSRVSVLAVHSAPGPDCLCYKQSVDNCGSCCFWSMSQTRRRTKS